jgi:hypothetical protein
MMSLNGILATASILAALSLLDDPHHLTCRKKYRVRTMRTHKWDYREWLPRKLLWKIADKANVPFGRIA